MAIKTLLVCLTTSEHAETLMKLAAPLAQKHNAHLIGLHTTEALIVYPGIAMHIPEKTFAAYKASQQEEAEKIKAIFSKYTQNADFQGEFRLVHAEAHSATERMVESARSSDLVIMSHGDSEADHYDQRQAQTHVIRQSGRPVIVVPLDYEGPTVGTTCVLGWSDTREAARAAHDLVSLTHEGADITVLRVGNATTDELRDSDGIELSEMLARHGLKPTLERREAGQESVADVLNKVAFEKGADLIVTGAFGHSRTYDFVIGAATFALLRDAKIPVMFSK